MSRSYGALPPLDELSPDEDPEVVPPLDDGDDDEDDDEEDDDEPPAEDDEPPDESSPPGESGGTQSLPLSTVPSGHVPGESACLAPPPHAASASKLSAATILGFMARIIPRARGVAPFRGWPARSCARALVRRERRAGR
jgi:hypothetical protein